MDKAKTQPARMRRPAAAPALPAGAYVNLLQIMTAPSEIHLTFGQHGPGQTTGAHLLSSLVTTPIHAKAMLRVLAETLENYEEKYGVIPALDPLITSPER